MDWPSSPFGGPRVNISTLHPESVGASVAAAGQVSTTYPVANLAIFMPFRIGIPITVKQLFSYNGLVAAGNIDMGIYDRNGVRLVSAGSTAQAGTSDLQAFNITDTQIGPGLFYIAIAKDDIVGTLIRITTGASWNWQVLGLAQQASAFPLPATATFAAYGQLLCPFIGLSTRDVL